MKDFHDQGKSPSQLKRTYSSKKHEIALFLFFFWGGESVRELDKEIERGAYLKKKSAD